MAITCEGTSTARGVMEESTPSHRSPSNAEEQDEWKTRLEETQAQQGEGKVRIEEQLAQMTQLLAQLVAAQARTASPLTEP